MKNHPLWQLGFRPFFLFGSLAGAALIGLWISVLSGIIHYTGFFDPITWHAHEMIYGFSVAIIGGFILTAIQNWTGERGVHGTKLIALFVPWFLARIAIFLSSEPSLWITILDLFFYPWLCFLLVPFFIKDRELKMERVFFVFFLFLFTGNLLIHLEALHLIRGYTRMGLWLGFFTVISVIVMIGGRVIPFFTESSIAKSQPKTYKPIEILAPLSVWIVFISQSFSPWSKLNAVIAIGAAGIHWIRLWGWSIRRVRRVPLVWVLHLGYFWIGLGFLFFGLSSLEILIPTLAVHTWTVGGIGIIILGMISRVSLGHTGRRLHPEKLTVIGYYCLGFATLIRVFGPMINYEWHLMSVQISGIFWVLGFAIFFKVYWPILTQPRADSRPG